MTAEDERAAVVAWLRDAAAAQLGTQSRTLSQARYNILYGGRIALECAADALERGDHITPGGGD